ncbi:M28 family peptidase [Massilia sp. G4R7]|uniref:M28 family peptidase n=1 Tax=Massilia phyllostachyos TaxID=2898585 RepID=A0ABS8Q567_9BURK|nr:M28 family peptidase [Massilia phyllostachyos]MCD2516883.1 M28 family peptidase [Massilia phyllostachyos]
MLTAGLPAAPTRALGLAAFAAVCIALALAWLARTGAIPEAPPVIDAARMERHLANLAAAPRPIATRANAAARDYILNQLRGMGLDPGVQRATVSKATIRFGGGTHYTMGVVHNVVVRLPGSALERARRPALLLATHYDSGKTTLGAARAALPVAALLESARALHAKRAHANDIVLLFADGEDVGALGAQGFAEHHPWARDVGLALRFDSMGSGGPLLLLDASNAGGAVLGALPAAAPQVEGSALLAGLYRLLPDTPRIGPLGRLGAPSLLIANTGKRFDGERVLDTIERLDPALPAQLGAAMLGMARHYGDADLERGGHGPRAWFTVPGLGPVQHSAILCWTLAALSALMLVHGYRQVLAQARDTVAPLVQGFFGVALVLLATRMWLWERRGELAALTRDTGIDAALTVVIVGVCLFTAALYLLRRFVGAAPVFLGTMAWLLAGLLLALALAPGAAYVLAWPLAAALGAWTALPRLRSIAAKLLLLAAALLTSVLLLVPALEETWRAMAPHGLYLPSLAIAVLLAAFTSLFLLLTVGRVVAAAMLLACAGCLMLPTPAARPAPVETPTLAPDRLVYFKDMNSWRAYWLLPPDPLDDWSKRLFPDLAKPSIHVDVFGWHSPRQWFAVAPREDAIAYPEGYLLRKPRPKPVGTSGRRQVEFTLRSKNRAPHIELWAGGTEPLASTVNGRAISSKETIWSMSLYGMEDTLLRYTFDIKADEVLAVVVEERMPGLPVHLLPPGAPGKMPGTGMTVSSDVLRFY